MKAIFKAILTVGALLTLLCCDPSKISANDLHPNMARGSGDDKVLDRHQWDSVNLFNGNLLSSIPLGSKYPLTTSLGYQFIVSYNSNIWDLRQTTSNLITAAPNKYSNAGLGWDLSFGRLIDPAAAGNQLGTWIYISPDGASHSFYATLHADVYEPDDNVFYTRDNTYYRLKKLSSTTCTIESPNGIVNSFEFASGEWRLTRIADRFKSYLAISYGANTWTLTDNHGRTQVVNFKSDPSGYYPRLVDSVVIASFGGGTATYKFAYATGTIARPSIDNDPATSSDVVVTQLESITAPDNSKHSLTYHWRVPGMGRLASMKLPTLGAISWSYGTYSFTSAGCPTSFSPLYQTNIGVFNRHLIDSTGVLVGSWTYTPGLNPYRNGTTCVEESEMTNTVKTPLGDKTVYYFSVNTLGNGRTGWTPSDYALPFTRSAADRPITYPANVALAANGATAVGSSVVNSNYPEAAAINGDRKGMNWGSGGGWNDGTQGQFPDWLQVNFAGSKTISEIDVFTIQENYTNPVEPTLNQTFNTSDSTGQGITAFDVQYWNGSTWMTVSGGSVTGNNKVWRQFKFPPLTTDKIRVVVNSSVTWSTIPNNYSRIVEIEAHQPSTSSDARFLSRQHFDCDTAGNNCALKRSEYVRYEQDINTNPALIDMSHTNRREVSTRTVYHDDVENGVARYADINRSDFDGLGHFRRTVTDGNFGAGDVRDTFTNYNPASKTYPLGGFVVPAPNAPWNLSTYNQVKVTEANSGSTAGNTTNIVDYCFNNATGFLNRKRLRVSTVGPHSSDVVTVFTPDAAGEVDKEQYYGGDVQYVNTGPLCSFTLPVTDQYRIQHGYQYGVRSATQFYDGAGYPFGPRTVDQDIDRNTGLTTADRDSAGIKTAYEYDAMGRVTWARPDTGHGAWTGTTYHPATSHTWNGLRIHTTRYDNAGAVADAVMKVYDAFGSIWAEQKLMPDGNWTSRYRHYNALGWLTHQSGFSAGEIKWTQYLNYDPFGRYAIQRPPDGSHHDTNYEYAGIRSVKRTAKVGTSYTPSTGVVNETPLSTTYVFDRQGRKWQEIAHARPNSSDPNVVTTCSYDITGSLRLTTRGGRQVGPAKSYDRRGFLSSMFLDDRGQGAETTTYLDIDAFGNSLRTQRFKHAANSTVSLANVYDRAGRLIVVRDPNNTAKIWKEFVYAEANGPGDLRAGKLWKTTRYNDMSRFLSNVGVATVSETYTYGGVGGRVSQYTIGFADQVGRTEVFTHAYTYTEQGEVKEIIYPNDVSGSSYIDIGRERKVAYAYSHGLLTGVSGSFNGQSESWANSITYHSNRLISQVNYSNGVAENVTPDPSGFVRPASVSTTGATNPINGAADNLNSGAFQYDGIGQLLRAGTEYFVPQEGAQTTEPSASAYQGPCELGFEDAIGMVYASTDDQCNARVFYFYTADDRIFKIEDGVKEQKIWHLWDSWNRLLTVQTMVHTHYLPWANTWQTTRDYVYRGGRTLATYESFRDRPTETLFYHSGYGAKGIVTDRNGKRIR